MGVESNQREATDAELNKMFRGLDNLEDVRVAHGSVTGRLGRISPEKIVAACVHQGVPVLGFRVGAPSLEDVFVSLTGEGFDVSG